MLKYMILLLLVHQCFFVKLSKSMTIDSNSINNDATNTSESNSDESDNSIESIPTTTTTIDSLGSSIESNKQRNVRSVDSDFDGLYFAWKRNLMNKKRLYAMDYNDAAEVNDERAQNIVKKERKSLIEIIKRFSQCTSEELVEWNALCS